MIPWDEFWPAMFQVLIGVGLFGVLIAIFVLVLIYFLERNLDR